MTDNKKFLIRVLDNGRILVRDFADTEFKTFKTLDQALTFVKQKYIESELEDSNSKDKEKEE